MIFPNWIGGVVVPVSASPYDAGNVEAFVVKPAGVVFSMEVQTLAFDVKPVDVPFSIERA